MAAECPMVASWKMPNRRKRSSSGRRRALADHKQDGKVLQPPFLAGLAAASAARPGAALEMRGHTWHDDILPELFWLALLYRRMPQRTCAIATTLIGSATELIQGTPPPAFAFASEYSKIPRDLVATLHQRLASEGVLDDLLTALLPQRILYPDCPMNVLFEGMNSYSLPREDALREAFEAGRIIAVRRTADAAVIQGMALLGMALARPQMLPYRIGFEYLHLYPQTAESRAAEQQTRVAVGGLSAVVRDVTAWREHFWRQGFAITPCLPADDRFHEGSMDSRSVAESLVEAFEKLDAEVVQALEMAWSKSPIDLAHPLESELYGALLARQVRFVRHLLSKPVYWNGELGGIVLRGMAESAITLGWLVRKGSAEDRERFWLYGLGQEKLALDHLSASPVDGEFLDRRRKRDISARREWLESQRTNQLLPVDLSNWTPLRVRQLAEQGEMIETYNAVYGPMSAYVHGSWNALGRTCMRYCMNPLHRFHMVPDIQAVSVDLTVPLSALRVLLAGWEAYREWAPEVDPLTCCERSIQQVVEVLDTVTEDTTPDQESEGRPAPGE
jgi:hypothetical protein